MRYFYIFSLFSLIACNNTPKESSQVKEETSVQSNNLRRTKVFVMKELYKQKLKNWLIQLSY